MSARGIYNIYINKTLNEMNEIQIFEHEQFGEIRICQIENKVWFCLSDVCKALTLANPARVKERLDEGGIHTVNTPVTNQYGDHYVQPMTYINEPNLYRCIFQSRKAEAEQFQSWVFDEVLPQIRRTGGFIPVSDDETAEQTAQRVIEILKRTLAERDQRLAELNETVHEQVRLIAQQRHQLRLQQPRVEFANALAASPDSILLRDMAKLLTQNGYRIGQNRLFRELRRRGYIFQNSTRPIQHWVEQGIFDTCVSVIKSNHATHSRLATRVTAKGQRYFLRLFLGQQAC